MATRAPRRTFVVFGEGERTEPEYLNALKRERAVREIAAVDIRVQAGTGGSTPLRLVEMAAAARRKAIDDEGEVRRVLVRSHLLLAAVEGPLTSAAD